MVWVRVSIEFHRAIIGVFISGSLSQPPAVVIPNFALKMDNRMAICEYHIVLCTVEDCICKYICDHQSQ